jgi:hypothetical protein
MRLIPASFSGVHLHDHGEPRPMEGQWEYGEAELVFEGSPQTAHWVKLRWTCSDPTCQATIEMEGLLPYSAITEAPKPN